MDRKSKALIVGIDDYESVSPLRGCVNDTRDIADVLIQVFEFPADSVKVLVDRDVRRSKLRPLMNWLFEDMAEGDRAVFHFSGHGSQVVDEEGEETDGLDEILCLQDMSFDRPSSYLTDDELARWTKRCPRGVILNVFLDCCHSGTGTRKLIPPLKTLPSSRYPRIIESTTAHRVAQHQLALQPHLTGAGPGLTLESMAELARALAEPPPEDQVLARFVDPPLEVQRRMVRRLETRTRSRAEPFEVVPGLNHLLLAACQDYQTAADASIDGQFRGAFSCYLGRILREAGRELDRHELILRLTRILSDHRFEQVPRLEAAHAHGPLLSLGTDEPSSDQTLVTELPAQPDPGILDTDSPAPPPERPTPADGSELYRELLATFNRLLDLIQPSFPSPSEPGRPTAAGLRHVVYVHGIGPHSAGYSDRWWSALSPHAPSLRPGIRGGNRHEVLWSDLVNRPGPTAEGRDPASDRLAHQIREELQGRALWFVEGHRALESSGDPPVERLEHDAIIRGVLSGIDDFARYMTSPALRRAVLERFAAVVRPLLHAQQSLILISHSWGTVVAFEGLRQLEADPAIPPDSIHAWFTVGSALSISAVRRNLMRRVPDGRKPRSVACWINVNARGDLIGGPLQAQGFGVDVERLGLPPVGCGPLNLVCAHASYFEARNLAVNRDVFAAFIERS
ncbi:MAG: hypothetical protein KatS3mg108_1150 [Isosphaeraceae bacterium]|jgi:hypothetical protein|nr:MAG: hypothetical protein KatS3mg108_1150 [Isosphaeraceae bacterium]